MQRGSHWLLALGVAALTGCAESPVTNPSGSALPLGSQLGYPLVNGDREEAAVGIFTIAIDPATLTATAQLKETRAAQQTDDVYVLSIQNFIRPTSLEVTGVRDTGTTIELNYTFTHPFAKPVDINLAPSATNRTDLSVSGRIVFLVDVNSATGNTYFASEADPVVAASDPIRNHDGYCRPLALLNTTGMLADTFPFKLLVDESLDARTDRLGNPISNGGNPTGNYDADLGGWQRSNLGDGDDWTGYGVLHQGQVVSDTLVLNRAALSAEPLSFDAAILVSYQDPRGGSNATEKRGNRLPAVTPDVTRFAYRMPHGAQDLEAIAYAGESGGFLTNQVSASTLRFQVRDWDCRGTETLEANLADDPLVDRLAAGESGLPALSLSIPAVLGPSEIITFVPADLKDDDSVLPGGDPAPESGAAGDALFYEKLVQKSVISGQIPGFKVGMVRAAHPEPLAEAATWLFPLQPDLQPLTIADIPMPFETFQAFRVNLSGINQSPSATIEVAAPTVITGGIAQVRVSNYGDPEGEDITVRIDWNNDGDYFDTAEVNMVPAAGGPPIIFTSTPLTYTWSGSNPDIRDLPCEYTDSFNPPIPVLFLDFSVLDVPPVTCGVAMTAADITTWFGGMSDHSWDAIGATGQTSAWGDVAAFPTPAYDGWVYHHMKTSAPQKSDFYRITATNPPVATPITSLGALLDDTLVHQVEIDTTNRVLFASRFSTDDDWAFGPYDNYGEPFGAVPNIRWFDYSGSVVTALGGTITTTAPIIALAVDQVDDLYAIDKNHVMHKYFKSGGYTEVTDAPFPLDLSPIIGIYMGITGSDENNRGVCDFVIDYHNQAFYILVETGAYAPALNGKLFRVECNGTFNSTTPLGNPNPFDFRLAQFGLGVGADLTIDQRDATGAILATTGDMQLIISTSTNIVTLGPDTLPDFMVVNAELEVTASLDIAADDDSMGQCAVSLNNMLIGKDTYWMPGTGVQLMATPPAGWQ